MGRMYIGRGTRMVSVKQVVGRGEERVDLGPWEEGSVSFECEWDAEEGG